MAQTYTVKEGDTLNEIASSYGMPNHQGITGYSSGNPDLIRPGEVLTIPDNQLVVGSGSANMEFSNYSGELSNALSSITQPSNQQNTGPEITTENVGQLDPYGRMLDSLSQSSNASTKALISSIQASRMNKANSVNAQYDNYKRGLQLLGIQHNDAQSTPDLLMGHIQQAENEQYAKIDALDREEKKLIMDAETAQKKDDLATLKEKMDRVKAIKEEKNQALKDIADQLNTENSIAEDEAHRIYDQLQKLDDADKEIFLQEVAKKYKIPLIALVTAIADEKKAREEKAKKAAGTGGGGYSPQELRKLRAAGIDPSDIKTADDFLYNGIDPEDADEGTATPTQSISINPRKARRLERVGFMSEDIIKLQEALNSGYTLDEIQEVAGYSEQVMRLLRKFVEDIE